MSYPPDPNNPYGPPPQNPQGGADNPYGKPPQNQQGGDNPYGQPPQNPQQPQPGYGYPQQPAQPAPGYGYPQAPNADPGAGPYGYPQQSGYPGVAGATPAGYVDVPERGQVLVATYGQRVGARLLDTVIAYVAYWILSMLATGGLFLAAGSGDSATAGAAVGAFIVSLLLLGVIFIFYDVIFVCVMGATPGKKLLGLSVIDSRNGRKPGFGSALLRWGFPVGLGMLTCGLGYVLILISPFFDSSGKLQGWHDKAATTLVIKG